jgi:hypothetical protein
MRVHRYVLPVLLLVALLGSYAAAELTGRWITSGKEMIQLDAGGAADPAGIKGWMTLQQVSDGYNIPLDELYTRLKAPKNLAPTTALKDLESAISGFEVTLVRDQVTAYRAAHPETAQTPGKPIVTPAGAGK